MRVIIFIINHHHKATIVAHWPQRVNKASKIYVPQVAETAKPITALQDHTHL